MRSWQISEAGPRRSPFLRRKHLLSLWQRRRVLITTDVWARGIDVQQVSLVINYDLPA
jgi:ATP-dependent RNA helicase